MFLTNSLKKKVLARPLLVAGAALIWPPSFQPHSRVSHLGVRSFIVEPNQQGPQSGAKSCTKQPREEQRARREIPNHRFREVLSESRGISPYLTGLLVVGFGLTAYGL